MPSERPTSSTRLESEVRVRAWDPATDAGVLHRGVPCAPCGAPYFLVESDESKGLHNPGFVTAVLDATLRKDLSN